MSALEILGLAKSYTVGFWRKRLKAALQPLHLTVEEGEVFGFLGPNGAGKTTTLKLLMGIVFPTSGSARILGRDFHDPDVKKHIGFVHDPKIVFLDEPMSGLDPLGRREIRELLQELKDQGKTVFFSTHILSDAEALCDRVAVIHKGELRGIGVVEDLQSKNVSKSEVV